jgi:hypothetical protein
MTQQAVARPSTGRLTGAVADGGVKVVLGAVFVIGADRLGDRLGVATWLMVIAGTALLIGGGAELKYVRSRSMDTYLRLMVAYDSGWALVTLVGLLIAWQGGSAGGEVWIGYQAVAPIAFVGCLLAAAPAQPAST